MTVRQVVECQVCKTRTLLRTLLGWLPEHPIRIPCGHCGILIQGKVTLEQEKPDFEFEFVNGTTVPGEDSTFYIECSGEMLTEKLKERASLASGEDLLSPFIKAFMDMGFEQYQEFKKRTLQFLGRIQHFWPSVHRANQLWSGKKGEFLRTEIHSHLDEAMFPATNRLEQFRGLHQLNLLLTFPITEPLMFDSTVDLLRDEVPSLIDAHRKSVDDCVAYFGEELLMSYSDRFHRVLERMVETFPFLIPGFSLSFCPAVSARYTREKGMTTTGFEDVKQFYIDCYEDAAEILPLVAALNNLKHRGDFMCMKPVRRDVKTLDAFRNATKGTRLQFFDGSEMFDRMSMGLNPGIRNAIGHSSYQYDGIGQVIRYFPKGTLGKGDEVEMYLTEFTRLCWDVFQNHIHLNEAVYHISKIYYIQEGDVPMDPAKFREALANARKQQGGDESSAKAAE